MKIMKKKSNKMSTTWDKHLGKLLKDLNTTQKIPYYLNNWRWTSTDGISNNIS